MLKPLLPWFSAAFLAVGLPWWMAPYNRFSFSHPLSILGFLVFVCLATWAAGGTSLGLRRATLAVGAAVPCAVMARVVVDVAKDPTSHNLWPFEVILMGVMGFGIAFVAGLLGRLFRRVLAPN
ncbi:hypothetical protein [Geothrix campi]|uniref:hypothetical protein n=1 Tax=Geothrix campi TaxID=2966450 RepID=UPI00214861E6|nr:hypothetical protein [Geothrix sp. SG10]